MLNTAKEDKIPVEEALAALRSCPSSVDGFSLARIFYRRDLHNPELPDINDGQDEELLGRERQVKKEEARLKRNSKVSKTLQRYTPKVGDLVYLQDTKSLRWDIPATIQLVRPGGRYAYCLTEDDTLYLHSNVHIRLRTIGAECIDAQPSPDRALTEQPASTEGADLDTETEESLQSAMQASVSCGWSMKKPSIM